MSIKQSQISVSDLITILAAVPEADRAVPVCLYTGWEGHESMPAHGATVEEGEYVGADGYTHPGRYLLIS